MTNHHDHVPADIIRATARKVMAAVWDSLDTLLPDDDQEKERVAIAPVALFLSYLALVNAMEATGTINCTAKELHDQVAPIALGLMIDARTAMSRSPEVEALIHDLGMN